MSVITINGNSFDPASIAVHALGLESVDASQSNYILIQTSGGPLKKEQKEKLRKKDVKIHEYVSKDTYLCGYKPEDLSAIRDLHFIQYANVYLPEFVVQPSLKTDLGSPVPGVQSVFVESDTASRAPRTVDIILHQDLQSSADVKSQIAAIAHADPDAIKDTNGKIRLNVERRYLDALAAVDAVRNIQEVHPVKLCNNVAREILRANVDINGTTYKGEGEIVAVADTGFDTGDLSDPPTAFAGRVLRLYALGRPTTGRSDDPNGHGTHVCGSVLGDVVAATMGGRIEAPASKAKLVMQSLLALDNSLSGIPDDLNNLFEQPYTEDGARVHTNSWGPVWTGRQLPYDGSAAEIDNFVWKHPDMVICFAAGNDGADRDVNGVVDSKSIGAHAAAKNCITVGATESYRPDIQWTPPIWRPTARSFTYGEYFTRAYSRPPVSTDHMANNMDGMAAFSSRGPTKEQRFKPDVVAPGSSILSTASRRITPPTHYGISLDPALMFDTGTSMATPLVAGCCAVLRQTLVMNGVGQPSAALIKALLINGAVDIIGQYNPSEAKAAPNGDEGWGRVDLAGSVIIPGQQSNGGCGNGNPLDDDKEFEVKITIPEKGVSNSDSKTSEVTEDLRQLVRLKVTLVYSDYPGVELQNDLNLIVIGSRGSERHGNMGTRNYPIGSLEGFDGLNNVEQVIWERIPSGEATIKVRASRITAFAQPFAYAWRIY